MSQPPHAAANPAPLTLGTVSADAQECVYRKLSAIALARLSFASKAFHASCTAAAEAAMAEMRAADLRVDVETTMHRLARLCGVRFATDEFHAAVQLTQYPHVPPIAMFDIAAVEKLWVLVGHLPDCLIDAPPGYADTPPGHADPHVRSDYILGGVAHDVLVKATTIEFGDRRHLVLSDVDAAWECFLRSKPFRRTLSLMQKSMQLEFHHGDGGTAALLDHHSSIGWNQSGNVFSFSCGNCESCLDPEKLLLCSGGNESDDESADYNPDDDAASEVSEEYYDDMIGVAIGPMEGVRHMKTYELRDHVFQEDIFTWKREWYESAADFFDYKWYDDRAGVKYLALSEEDAVTYHILEAMHHGGQEHDLELDSNAPKEEQELCARLQAMRSCNNPLCCHQACGCRLASKPAEHYDLFDFPTDTPHLFTDLATVCQPAGVAHHLLTEPSECPQVRFLRNAEARMRKWFKEGRRNPQAALDRMGFRLELGVPKF